MDPIESEIINDPVIRAQYDAAVASDKPLRRRPECHTPETWRVRAMYVAQSPKEVSGPEFDRWLAKHDQEVLAPLVKWVVEVVAFPFDSHFDTPPPIDPSLISEYWRVWDEWTDVTPEEALDLILEEGGWV